MRHPEHTPAVAAGPAPGEEPSPTASWSRCLQGRFAIPCGVIVGLALAWLCGSRGFAAQRATRPIPAGINGPGGQFWTMTTPLEDGRHMLLLLDQQSRCLAVYHVDPAAGTVQLKSTRDITWDLMIEEFNAQEPKPSALKKMAEMPK